MYALSCLLPLWKAVLDFNANFPPPRFSDERFRDRVLQPMCLWVSLFLETPWWAPPRHTNLGRLYYRSKRCWQCYLLIALLVELAPEDSTSPVLARLQFARSAIYDHVPAFLHRVATILFSFRWSKIPYIEAFIKPILLHLVKLCVMLAFLLSPSFPNPFYHVRSPATSAVAVPLLLVGIFEVVWYASTLSLLISTWATVYVELLSPFLLSCMRVCPKRSATLRRNLSQLLDNLKAELDPTLRTPLDQMHFPWLDLLQADEEYLAVCVDYHVAVGTGQPTWGTIPIGLLLHANQTLVNLLQDELLRHPSSPITKVVSFRNVRLELAGIIIKYFFPLPHLQRLSRPFRFEAFLPFLITYPSMQLVPPTFPQP